jgi:hypothetical protein
MEPVISIPKDPFFGKRAEDSPLATKALARRDKFPSLGFALKSFEGKAMTNNWDPRSVSSYVRGILKPENDNFVLKCEKQVEAEVYREGSSHTTYNKLHEIKTHVALIVGDDSYIYSQGII